MAALFMAIGFVLTAIGLAMISPAVAFVFVGLVLFVSGGLDWRRTHHND